MCKTERDKKKVEGDKHLILRETCFFEALVFLPSTSHMVAYEQPIKEPMDGLYVGASDTLVTMCFIYLSLLFTLICILY